MAVIDELVVVFNLDATKFNEAQRAAVENLRKLEAQSIKSGKEVEASGKKIIEFFVGLKREAVGFLAAFYGGRGIKDIVEHLTHLDASAARLAGTVNASATDIAKWRIAMQTIGGDASEADSAIQGLSDTWRDFLRNPGQPPVGLLAAAKQIGYTGDLGDPIKFLTALGEYAQKQRTPEERANFGALARDIPGMNQHMIQLLLELNKRLPAAAGVTPAGGGSGAFSEEFIASMVLFETAANNVARVILDYFVPAINSLTRLFTAWLTPPGSPEAKKQGEKLQKDLREHFGTPPAWLSRIFGLEPEPPQGSKPKLVPRGDTGVGGVFAGATGYSIEEGGVVIASGAFPKTGARSAAAVSNVSTKASQTSNTHTVTVDTINANLPGVKDAKGFAEGLRGAVPYLGAPFSASINGAY